MRSIIFALALFVTHAEAASYGDTAYVSTTQVNGCDDKIALSLPMSVSVSSRVHVSARASFDPGSSDLTLGVIVVELRDSGDSTTLATSQWAWGGGTNYAFAQSDGMLHSGTSVGDPNAAIYTATPGDYVLKMHVSASNGTCAGSSFFYQPTLSYILLSAAFDRIFADGFQATIDDGRAFALLA